MKTGPRRGWAGPPGQSTAGRRTHLVSSRRARRC